MEVRHRELQDERELLEGTPLEDLLTVLTYMILDNSALITVTGEQPGHLPKWGHPRDSDVEESYSVPLCSTVVFCSSYGLDSNEN
eukprot:2292213-Pyramimonas_sp.AAC.1